MIHAASSRKAKRVANRAQARVQVFPGKTEPFRQHVQRGITRRAHVCDGGIALALSITWIVDEQERVVRIRIPGKNRRPIQGKRAISAKRDPRPRLQSPVIACREYKTPSAFQKAGYRKFLRRLPVTPGRSSGRKAAGDKSSSAA